MPANSIELEKAVRQLKRPTLGSPVQIEQVKSDAIRLPTGPGQPLVPGHRNQNEMAPAPLKLLGHRGAAFVHYQAIIRKASCTGAQTSIPRSVARQVARRIISAPLACIGKFRSERGLTFSPI